MTWAATTSLASGPGPSRPVPSSRGISRRQMVAFVLLEEVDLASVRQHVWCSRDEPALLFPKDLLSYASWITA